VSKINELLRKYGIAFYSVLLLSCDRVSPLMDLVWIEKLGEGGFGEVHLVSNKHDKTRTALKLVKEDRLERALKEIGLCQRAAAASEFVAQYVSGGQASEHFIWLQTEFCAGGNIRKLLETADPPESGMADDALRWKLYLQICRGLEAIHAAGVFLLDPKPENSECSY
jgi:serine/threonine protein kinase